MVAHLLRLKLALLVGGLRRSVWRTISLIFAAVYGLGIAAGGVAGLALLSSADPTTISTVLVLGGSLLALGWWIIPLVAFGLDATLDPARFVTFAIPRRSLLAGLALSGLLGVPGAVTGVVVLASALAWWRHPVAALVAVPCAVLALATCIVGSRATTTLFARLADRRRYREVLAVAAIVPLMLLGPAITAVMTRLQGSGDIAAQVAAVVAWTPLGAAWAVPADVVDGAVGTAALRTLVAVATVVGLLAVWDRSLARALVRPASSGPGERSHGRGLGAFAWMPATPTGAVAARCLTYWARDPRYGIALAVVPVMPLLLFLTSQNAGTGRGILLIIGPLVGFLLGWTISTDVAMDSTAFWTHLAAPLSGRSDRVGRVLAAGLIGLPTTLLLTVGSVALADRWSTLPALLGASLGVLATTLGGASVISARVVYEVAKPGESPFASHQGAAMAGVLSQLAGWSVVLVLCLPELVLAAVAVARGSVPLGLLALVVGLALGTVLLVVGIRIGSQILERRAPELLERMVSFG